MIKSKNNSTAVLIVFIVAMLCFCAFHTDTTAAATKPGKVTLKSPTVTTNSVKVKWSKKSGVTGYQVYQSKDNSKNFKKIATVKGTSYTSKNLDSGTNYYYKVRAYKGKKYGSFSKIKKAKTLTPSSSIEAPTNFKAYVDEDNDVVVSWTVKKGYLYNIYRDGAIVVEGEDDSPYLDAVEDLNAEHTYGIEAVYNGKKSKRITVKMTPYTPSQPENPGQPETPGTVHFTEHPEVTLSYGSTTIYLGQAWSNEIYSGLKSGSSGEETVTRTNSDKYDNGSHSVAKLTQTVYMFDTRDYSDFLIVYVTNGQIVRWLSNNNMGKNGSQTFRLGDSNIPEKGYSMYKNANGNLYPGFPSEGVFLGGFTLNYLDKYRWCYEQTYANKDATPNINAEKRIAFHLVNALRHVHGVSPLSYHADLDGTGKSFTGTLPEGYWFNSDYSLGEGDLNLNNQIYGEQPWAETMHASGAIGHADFQVTAGPLCGKKSIADSLVRYIISQRDGLVNTGEVCRKQYCIGEYVMWYENSGGHHAHLVAPQYTHMGVGICGEYSGIMFAQPL